MPYILYKTDGTKLLTVEDASIDLSTELSFVGKNYSGYGQIVNENFLKLLENFASDTQPAKPIRGQLWYDKSRGRLHVSYDGRSFKGLANIFVQAITPSTNALVRGDLWWDSDAFQLKAFDGAQFQIIGPLDPAAGRAAWIPSEEEIFPNSAITTPISRATFNEEIVIVTSKQTFTSTNNTLLNSFPVIKRGITLSNADNNGNSANYGTILWGSAAHAIQSDQATTATFAVDLINNVLLGIKSSTSTVSVTYSSSATTSTQSYTIVQRDNNGDSYSNVFRGVATSARYADLAEKYAADNIYEFGTVLIIGGDKEVTVTDKIGNTAVVGVVSQNPGYMMNSAMGDHDYYPYIALKGRVPCRVVGKVSKGDLLITSNKPGYAQAIVNGVDTIAVFAKSLQDSTTDLGIVEALII